MLDTRPDVALLAATTTDPEAFAVFYRRHSRAVLIFISRRVPNAEAAADLTAEVFAAALEHRDRYQPSKGPTRAWLFGIASNVVARARRKGFRENAARRRIGMPPLVADSEELQRVEELIDSSRTGVAALVAELPMHERDAVLARIVDERDYAAIAQASGSSEPAIRQRVSRGLGRVALAFKKESR
jgi:RNA polymerase sigma factor (sigma-70 family)